MTDTPTEGGWDDLADLLGPFLAEARWFAGKGREHHVAGIRFLGELPAGPEPQGAPRVLMLLVEVHYAADGGDPVELYQVPLSLYDNPQERLEHALVGELAALDGAGTSYAYDALHDREAMALWLRAFDEAGAGSHDVGPLTFHRLPGHELDLTTHSTLFSGEQSNSSVAFGDDALLKVFRKVTPGENPDISIHEVLTEADSPHVAHLFGWLDVAEEPAPGQGDLEGSLGGGPSGFEGTVTQLAMLQQFLRTATNGWELALASVRSLFADADLHADEVGGDFGAESTRLGVALGQTHAALVEHFGTELWTGSQVTALADAMEARLDNTLTQVAELAPYADALRTVYDRVRGLTEVPIQRVHGDLHLGQTLRTARGWKIVDFEGEPAKPLTERVLPDSPWRDVAGMLRSFDYAPQVAARTLDGHDEDEVAQRSYRGQEWSRHNAGTFVASYVGRELDAGELTLLDAYVADKAVYETLYEVRNRPGWVDIPLGAIRRIGGAS